MKRVKIVFLLVLVAIAAIVIKKYIDNARSDKVFMKLGILNRSYVPDKDFIEVFSQEGLDYYKEDRKATKDSLKKILDSQSAFQVAETQIPLITHNIYFFSPKTPKILNDYFIINLKTNFQRLAGLNSDWKHYIWTNMPEMFPEEIKNIKGVEVKLVNEFSDHKLYKHTKNSIAKNNVVFLVEAADLMRLMAVEKYGGIYMDMDYEIYNPEILYKYMKKFNLIMGREKIFMNSYYGNAFFAASAFHPVIKEAIEIDNRNIYKLKDIKTPDYIKYPKREYYRVFFSSPPLITIAYFKKNNIEGNNDLVLPSWMVFNENFIRFKNKTCNLNEINRE